jgi:sulfur-carrier protein adenylyltransferase/sulfurtransferase
MAEVGILGQRRIVNAKVLVVGAGGLGSPVLLYLAAAGVGTLGIVDFDRVDESNLQRQIIHSQSSIGEKKVESAKAKIEEINPSVIVETHHLRLDESNVLDLFSRYDIIVDGTDNFSTRYLINDACVILNKPAVMGSIFRFDGQASVFWAAHGPCYRCVYPSPPPKELVLNCAEGGVLGALCASIGAIQATETLKLIVGMGSPLVGSIIFYDALESNFDKVTIDKDPNCPFCADAAQAKMLESYDTFCGVQSTRDEISAEELLTRMRAGEVLQIVDVREPHEWEDSHIPGATLIPLAEFFDGRAFEKITNERPVILYCHLGIRSARALAVLEDSGYVGAAHLRGGIVSWDEHALNG